MVLSSDLLKNKEDELMNKKAQIQMGESIFAVIIVIFIIVFILIFYSNSQQQEASTQQQKSVDLSSISLAQLVGTLPELGCSEREVIDVSCFDITKINAFVLTTTKQKALTEEYYATQLGTITISIKEIYPLTQMWVLYNNSLNASQAQIRQIQKPISLLDSITGDYAFGVIYITFYTRK